MQTAPAKDGSGTEVLSDNHSNAGEDNPVIYEGAENGDWPDLPRFEENEIKVSQEHSQEFEDANLADEAAGFVSHQPITMLMRRWRFRLFVFLVAAYTTFIGVGYGFGFLESELESEEEDGDSGALIWVVATYAVPAAFMWVAPFAAMCGHAHVGTKLVGLGMLSNGLFYLGVRVPEGVNGGSIAYVLQAVIVVIIDFEVAFVFLIKENSWWQSGLRTVAVCYIGVAVIVAGFRYLPALRLLIPATIHLCVLVGLLFRRWHSLRQAASAMKEDERRYNEAWEPVVATDKAALVRLSELVAQVENERVLQPFSSLGSVYKRAQALNDWYQAVVKHWADCCGVQFHAAPIKKQERVKEKIHRSYNGDFRRVLDILRSTIVVTDVADLAKVFELVYSQARVHQVKNRFDLDFDSTLTAGYRDMNCQVTFRQLDHTQFEGFVFELQVHFDKILALKSKEGHKRYIKLRNLRGD